MVAIEKGSRHQKIVVWEPSSVYAADGRPTLQAPAELTVRWMDDQREGLDPQGDKVSITATVVVDRAITVGSILWEGKMADLPDSPTGLMQVVAVNRVPDVKGRENYRELSLARYSNMLPDLA